MSISVSRVPEFEGAAGILSADALAFIEKLHQKFAGTRDELRKRLEEMEAAGVTEVSFHVAGPSAPRELEAFASLAL